MGNHKFRLSDMLPNAWFYKLKDMSKHSSSAAQKQKQKQKQHVQQQSVRRHNHPQTPSRKSYYFTRTNSNSISHSKSSSIDSLFPDPVNSSSGIRTDRSDLAPPPTPSPVELRSDRALIPTELLEESVSWSSSSNYEPRNIVIDVDDTIQLAAKIENPEDFVTIFEVELRPIVTKPKSAVDEHMILKSLKTSETEQRRQQSLSKGVKIRKANSPRIINNVKSRRKNVSSLTTTTTTTTTASSSWSKKSGLNESLAIVKRSKNPKEDFKKSMVEMIVEHEIRSSKELEELLACYLSLNSDEYHDLIISVFKQIWFQISNNDNNMMRRRRATATRPTATTITTKTTAPIEIIYH